MDGFGDVLGLNSLLAFQIGDRAGDFEDAIVCSGGKTLLGHGAFEQAFAIRGEFTECADVPRAHLGIAVGLDASGRHESL